MVDFFEQLCAALVKKPDAHLVEAVFDSQNAHQASALELICCEVDTEASVKFGSQFEFEFCDSLLRKPEFIIIILECLKIMACCKVSTTCTNSHTSTQDSANSP